MDARHRTTAYLSELRAEASRADFAAIVIGYDELTRFVWSTSDDPASRLAGLLDAGGKAVAILGADVIGNAFIYRLNPFPEYEDDADTRRYLAAVGERIAEILEQRLQSAMN